MFQAEEEELVAAGSGSSCQGSEQGDEAEGIGRQAEGAGLLQLYRVANLPCLDFRTCKPNCGRVLPVFCLSGRLVLP